MTKKNHSYEVNGRTFYTAQVVDDDDGSTYDQTVIFEEHEDDVPRVVDYYYGEPNFDDTKFFVDRSLNLTSELGRLLIEAVVQHIAPNAVADLAYEKLLAAGIDEKQAHSLSDCMFELACFVEPE